MRKHTSWWCWIVALGVLGLLSPTHAQQYPSKPLRLIVPFPPGGGTDTMGRILAQKLSEQIGQQVLVDNRPGGGANIGVEAAFRAASDGYTLVVVTITNAIGQSVYRKLNFDLVKDFAGIAQLATTPHVLVVHPSVPVKTVKDLIVFAKARPDQLAYSSSGSGSAAHLAGELFSMLTGTRMVHVPYKGGGPSMIALVAGEVSVCFATMPSAVGFVRDGRLRALALTTARRSPSMPDLPTVAEAGVHDFEAGSWYGLSAPAGTAREIVLRLNAEVHKVLAQPDVQARLDKAGFEVVTGTPEEYTEFVRTEIAKWGKIVKAVGLRVD
jgi:tripartite-type tricarboxylate transporter receptor subunit TctC